MPKLSTSQIGEQAEAAAIKQLKRLGYRLVVRNWRRPDCEIDLVMRRRQNGVLHFFEVRYRTSKSHGTAYQTLTPTKLNQMRYAARRYMGSSDDSYELAVITLSGQPMSPELIIETIDLD